MKLIINNSYKKYIIINLILAIDALILPLFSGNILLFSLYIALNVVTLLLLTRKMNNDSIIELIFFMMLTYVLVIEILVHYLNVKVFLEAQYLYIIPTLVLFLKTIISNQSKLKPLIVIFILFTINLIIAITTKNFSISFYIKTLIPYLSATMIYFIIKNSNYNFISLYKFIYFICVILTILQSLLGFHSDTRNGLFGVYGLNAYSIFLICYPIYTYAKWFTNEKKITEVIISIILTLIVLCLIENKMLIILFFIIFSLIPLILPKKSKKNIILPIICILMIPIAYKLLLYFNPKFSYLTSIKSIFNYIFKNNNHLYRYGRFQSLSIIFSQIEIFGKIFGKGLGASTPIDTVFLKELGSKIHSPYYIAEYGTNHGFQLTTLSTTLLDGGFIFLILILIIFLFFLIKSIKSMRDKNKNNNIKGCVIFGVIIISFFYYIYSNIFVSFKTLSIIAAIVAIKKKNIITKN